MSEYDEDFDPQRCRSGPSVEHFHARIKACKEKCDAKDAKIAELYDELAKKNQYINSLLEAYWRKASGDMGHGESGIIERYHANERNEG